MGKTDSTGTYTYLCDGTSPGAAVLSDGHAVYTPGLSERRAGTTAYYTNDRLGNLWTLNASGGSQLYYQDSTGFGNMLYAIPLFGLPPAGRLASSPLTPIKPQTCPSGRGHLRNISN